MLGVAQAHQLYLWDQAANILHSLFQALMQKLMVPLIHDLMSWLL